MKASLTPMLAAIGDYFTWWQGILLVALIVLLVYYWQYRKRQY